MAGSNDASADVVGNHARNGAGNDDPQPIMRGSDREVFRSFVTIAEMLADRGEDTTSLQGIAPEDVVALADGRQIFFVDVPSCGARIIYNLHPRFKLASVRKLLQEPDTAGATVTTYIVVTREKPQHSVMKSIAADVEQASVVQLFELRELQFNVSRHVMVPQHVPVRDEGDIAAVLQLYGLRSRFQLPIILSTDAMARYLGLKPGQLVRIVRPSVSAGTYTLYRCCMRAA